MNCFIYIAYSFASILSVQTLHPAVGTGIFFIILLIIGIIALASYSYFRFKQRTIGFQHFKEKDDIDATALEKSSNITNPNYENLATADASCDPFTVSDEQQVVSSDSHEAF
ncbi:hypothetical protein JRQ81_015245 [Phrynocephalus forsythii]|uniref:Uncharacterized protein n=1 Tax=Phrynocephalus forsythii TaxID=171643 RepID=A0A9Q0XWV7_9SAUR|nr:hypothetical protein JRQ81_015245 [Phrynocephalus forsythii]